MISISRESTGSVLNSNISNCSIVEMVRNDREMTESEREIVINLVSRMNTIFVPFDYNDNSRNTRRWSKECETNC